MHQPVIKLAYVHGRKLINVLVMNTEMKSLLIQPRSLTLRTYISLSKLFCPLLGCSRSILLLHHLNVFHNTFVSHKVIRRCMYQRTLDFQTFVCPIQNLVYGIFRQLRNRSLQCCFIFLQQRFYLPEYHHILIFAKWSDSTFINRE